LKGRAITLCPNKDQNMSIVKMLASAALGLAVSVSPAFAQCTQSKASATGYQPTAYSTDSMATSGDIVDVAVGAGRFTTLAAALSAAGLVETLKGTGPFTVFAPTDAAFAKLPAGTVESLLRPENRAKLVSILTYHVVPGNVTSNLLLGKVTPAKTVQGQTVTVNGLNGGVKVNGVNVIQADVTASNGTIHIIDTVLMPPAKTASRH
jgi:uncharacterized surface protein with fasciclin (FAS1) repeats